MLRRAPLPQVQGRPSRRPWNLHTIAATAPPPESRSGRRAVIGVPRQAPTLNGRTLFASAGNVCRFGRHTYSAVNDFQGQTMSKCGDDDFLAHWRDPALFSYTTEPAHLLRQIHDYVKQRAEHPALGLVHLGSTLTRRDIDAVLISENQVETARDLIARRMNRFS